MDTWNKTTFPRNMIYLFLSKRETGWKQWVVFKIVSLTSISIPKMGKFHLDISRMA